MQILDGPVWETLTESDTPQQALDDLREYQRNDPDFEYRVEPRRIYINRAMWDTE
jgi:hypothetical protein